MKLAHRQRAALYAMAGLGAGPLIAIHGRQIFQSYISDGGLSAFLAWPALLAIYYVIVRAILDLCRDCLDFFRGQYCVLGDQYQRVDRRSKLVPPYDVLTASTIRREFSTWQYTLFFWTFLEVIVAWIGLAGALFAFFRSPYPGGPAHPFYLSSHSESTGGLPWFIQVLSLLLVGFAAASMGLRFDLGISPLIQRFLGVPDTFPGQNTFSPSVNELFLKLTGRPM